MKSLVEMFNEALKSVGNARKPKKVKYPMKGKESDGTSRVDLPKKAGRSVRNHSMSGSPKAGNATMNKKLPPDKKDTTFGANKLPKHKPHPKVRGGDPFNKRSQKKT